MARYSVPIIGDGLTPETAFRPDIPEDMNYVANIESDEQGHPVFPTVECDVSETMLADIDGGEAVFVQIADDELTGPRLAAHNPKIVRE